MKPQILIFQAFMLCLSLANAHPGGNMIVVGEYVLWSYINPIDDPEHHACVMAWKPGNDPETLITSEFEASDFMFYANEDKIYIIEQRYIQTRDQFEIRILKTRIGEDLQVIWDWFEDKWRIGDAGFMMKSDQEVVFGRYPEVYLMKKGETPSVYLDFSTPINKIRAIGTQLLLIGENSCSLLNQNGELVKQWNGLINDDIEDAPLGRNQIFDADYRNGQLLLAYWGNRSFDLIDDNDRRSTLLKLAAPFTPHWVAFYEDKQLLFSSKLVFDGSTPRPRLVLMGVGEQQLVWNE